VNTNVVVVVRAAAIEFQVLGMYQRAGSYVCILLIFTALLADSAIPWHLINLPDEHVPYYFYSRPKLKKICL